MNVGFFDDLVEVTIRQATAEVRSSRRAHSFESLQCPVPSIYFHVHQHADKRAANQALLYFERWHFTN